MGIYLTPTLNYMFILHLWFMFCLFFPFLLNHFSNLCRVFLLFSFFSPQVLDLYMLFTMCECENLLGKKQKKQKQNQTVHAQVL